VPELKRSENRQEPKRIGLLGASFDTGNMGVSALAESAIKCILHRWPDAKVVLLGSSRTPDEHLLKINGRKLCIKKIPIRFCKNVFLSNHFLVLCLYAFLFKVFRGEKFKRFCAQRNASLRRIIQMDMVADITGGDSFSDIYGMRRFVLGFLRKWLVMLFNKDLVMLPQTYGPFERRLSKAMAKHILNRASLVYSRDRAGVGYVNKLINDSENGKVKFAPDVAFVLDARKPKQLDIEPSADIRAQDSIVVGLNVSGLLFNGGYSRNNMFGLRTDYRELICEIVEMLLKDEKVTVLLIPHVFPPPGYEVESDSDACLKIYERVRKTYPDRVFLVKGEYDQGEIKYIIGMCDFFVGSRMHSCIAALSQCVPAVGLAYSDKFEGVFETAQNEQHVLDMRNHKKDEILKVVFNAFEERKVIRNHLQRIIPGIQNKVMNLFEDISVR